MPSPVSAPMESSGSAVTGSVWAAIMCMFAYTVIVNVTLATVCVKHQ